jgi:hypothetical protein
LDRNELLQGHHRLHSDSGACFCEFHDKLTPACAAVDALLALPRNLLQLSDFELDAMANKLLSPKRQKTTSSESKALEKRLDASMATAIASL